MSLDSILAHLKTLSVSTSSRFAAKETEQQLARTLDAAADTLAFAETHSAHAVIINL